jgi:Leucine-rich repeat (LRR) protein
MDSRGAAMAINSIKSKKQYQMSQNSRLFDLVLPSKDIKFITVNMLCKNLKIIDVQCNKLESLPEEIAELVFLEKLKLDSNLIKRLPSKLRNLSNL